MTASAPQAEIAARLAAPRSSPVVATAVCAALVGAVAAVLAFYRISANMPWADEMQTVGYCLGSWRHGLYLATHSQNMPLGYWLISKILFSITGPNFTTMRVASGAAFVAFALLAFRLMRRWLPLGTATAAALLIATHPALVWHARDGRVYAILLLAEAASVSLLLARPFRGRAALWVAVSAAMVYLHHHALLVLAIEAAVLFDKRPELKRYLPWVAALVLPDLVLVYLAMQSPNVASQMFGAGQTFSPNVLMTVERLGAGVSEINPLPPLPFSAMWREILGAAILLAATLVTALRGRTVDSWLGLAVLILLIVPPALHDALDVFYEPRFVVVMIPLAMAWLIGAMSLLPTRIPALGAAAALAAVFLWSDVDIVRPHVSPYRPARAEINADLAARPGKIIIHPGYLVGCWPLPQGFETAGGVVLSETGAMVGVEKKMAEDNAIRYSPDMPWSRFRREVVQGESFTLIQGAPGLYPRPDVDFCRPDEPWQTGYRCRQLWPDHPFVTIIRFEKTP